MIELLKTAGPYCLFAFAGAFALASLNHDLRLLWARWVELKEELNDDDL